MTHFLHPWMYQNIHFLAPAFPRAPDHYTLATCSLYYLTIPQSFIICKSSGNIKEHKVLKFMQLTLFGTNDESEYRSYNLILRFIL